MFAAEFHEELKVCPYCSSGSREHLKDENGYSYVECKSCELIYLSKRLRPEHLHLIYGDHSYHNVDNPKYQLNIARKRLKFLGELPVGARIHEDGAGSGAFLKVAQERGFKITGSDLGEDSVKKGKEAFGVTIHHGSVETVGLQRNSLDVFVAFNLLCHLYAPWDYLQKVSSYLRQDGLFLTRIGDRTGFFRSYGKLGAPEHVFHFGIDLLKKMYGKVGLEVIDVKPAFDSDFPYLFFDAAKTSRLAHFFCQNAVRVWNFLELPKEDVFILARKSKTK